MCGITGIANSSGQSVDPAVIHRMTAAVRHRGPDDTNRYVSGNVGFGHARLSIIDVEGGAQPMANADHTLVITFNGEIFNYCEIREELVTRGHRFKTRSDTEVILHSYQEWGTDCVHRFNGQWAFALHDKKNRRVFLSRDRMGVRPLFYCVAGQTLVFASEIKSLLAHDSVPREVDHVHSLEISTNFLQGTRCLYRMETYDYSAIGV
jgi:asparagine synthase (glutamine-hydrolysing)